MEVTCKKCNKKFTPDKTNHEHCVSDQQDKNGNIMSRIHTHYFFCPYCGCINIRAEKEEV